MREVVGAQIGNLITNNRQLIVDAYNSGDPVKLLFRGEMKFMADMDLGKHWENMASGPTLFRLDKDGAPHAPVAQQGGE